MSVAHHEPGTDAARLRQRGLRVTGPRLAILSMLEEVGGHRSADELVLALRRAGYHHARTTVYNALDDLARAGLVRAAPVDAGALRYESAGDDHHHFVCRACGVIRNVDVAPDFASRRLPDIDGARVDEFDVVYRGVCRRCAEASGTDAASRGTAASELHGLPEREHAMVGTPQNAKGAISGPSTSTLGSDRLVDLRGR